jgi:hypothetical protein
MVLDDCMKIQLGLFLENRIQKLNLKYNVKTSEVAKLIYISFGYTKQT